MRRPADHSDHLRRGELADEAELERADGRRPRGDPAAPRVPRPRPRRWPARRAWRRSSRPSSSIAAGRRSARPAAGCRSRANLPIDTFVVLMMENRSFDHYFGWHPDADAQEHAASATPTRTATRSPTHRLTPDFQGCDFRDPDHGWDGGRHQWNGGRNDGFVTGNAEGDGSDEFAAGYYLKEDLGFIPHAADAFTLYDRWFCSIMASTYPNRHYQWGAQNGGQKSNEFPETGPPTASPGRRSSTGPLANGVSATYYNSDLPFAGPLRAARDLAGRSRSPSSTRRPRRGRCRTSASSTRRSRTAAGATASRPTSTRTATSGSGRRSCPTSSTPSWSRRSTSAGPLFINYDEWGGFFDHVPPALRPRRPREPRRPRRELGLHRLPRSPGSRSRPTRAAATSATCRSPTSRS